MLLPCSVSGRGDSQGDGSRSYTQGRTVDTHQNKERERSRSRTHSLCLVKSPSLILPFACEPNGPGDKCSNSVAALPLTILIGDIADYIMLSANQSVSSV